MERRDSSDNIVELLRDGSPDMIDLTDEAFEDAEVPRHYISWLTDLIKRAKIKPTPMNQRLEGASISNDIIVIDEEDINETNTKTSDESQATKVSINPNCCQLNTF